MRLTMHNIMTKKRSTNSPNQMNIGHINPYKGSIPRHLATYNGFDKKKNPHVQFPHRVESSQPFIRLDG